MSTQAALGSAAIDKKDYPAAIAHLTKALAESPTSPNYFILRSTANQRAQNHEAALADAEAAVHAAIARSRRELVATAQFRRAVALHGLGRFGDSRLCLNWCRQKNEKEKGLTIWQAKVKADYELAGGDEAECNQCTVKEIPEKEAAKVEKGKAPEKPVASAPTPVSAPAVTPKEKIRQEWFQSNSTVTITIFAKGVAKESAQINIEDGQVEVSFPIGQTDTTYDFTASPLYAQIDPTKSKFNITPNKVEIDLHKSKQGLKWSSLEGTKPIISKSTEENKPEIPAAILNPKADKDRAPSYPTSSRNGPKDWDALASSALTSEKKEGAETTAEDDDEFGSDPLSAFFKKIYKDADPDAKRAMMKSYVESNGTALSTSWDQAKEGKFETTPPGGFEEKKW